MTRTSPCGCAAAVDPASGVLRRVAQCRRHRARRRDPATLDQAYYRGLGALDPDAPERYVGELQEALGSVPFARHVTLACEPPIEMDAALEVGSGASPYARYLIDREWRYFGVDRSRWAAAWARENVRGSAWCCSLDELPIAGPAFGLVLAAHVLEHLDDAPGAIRRCADLLAPGGELWVIVPDDSDLGNPDHDWYFAPDTLRACVERAGLTVERLAVRRHVPHELFIYVKAIKTH